MSNGAPERIHHMTDGNPAMIKVLMYHRVVADAGLSRNTWTCIHESEFRRQLEYLDDAGFTTITFNDYRLFLAEEINLPRKPVIITFDDGYLDTFRNAYPVMKEYGMRGVVFVLGDRSIRSNVWDSVNGMPEAPLMEDHDIIELHEAGFEIGAHSRTHARLSELTHEKAWEEISRTRMLLEILLNAPVRTFSYPYGLLNGTVQRMVEDAGFAQACSVYSGPASFGLDPFQIRRITIRNTTSLFDFRIKMRTPYEYYDWLRWKISQSVSAVKAKRTIVKTSGLAREEAGHPDFSGTR